MVSVTDAAAYAEIRMMMRIGSLAIVMQNMAAGGPNEMRAQPKNSLYVMAERRKVKGRQDSVAQTTSPTR